MKCYACGYYHMDDWEIDREDEVFKEETIRNNGKEKFAPIKIVAKVEQGHYYTAMEPAEITLHVCPRCGTIRSEDYGVRYGL